MQGKPPSQGLNTSHSRPTGASKNQGGSRAGFLPERARTRQTMSSSAVPSAATEASRDWTVAWPSTWGSTSTEVSQDPAGGLGSTCHSEASSTHCHKLRIHPAAVLGRGRGKKQTLKTWVSAWKSLIWAGGQLVKLGKAKGVLIGKSVPCWAGAECSWARFNKTHTNLKSRVFFTLLGLVSGHCWPCRLRRSCLGVHKRCCESEEEQRAKWTERSHAGGWISHIFSLSGFSDEGWCYGDSSPRQWSEESSEAYFRPQDTQLLCTHSSFPLQRTVVHLGVKLLLWVPRTVTTLMRLSYSPRPQWYVESHRGNG